MQEKTEKCEICPNIVRVQIYRGTGVCSEMCRQIADGERSPDESEK